MPVRVLNGQPVQTASNIPARRADANRLTIIKNDDGSNEVVAPNDPRLQTMAESRFESIGRHVRGVGHG